MESLEIISQRIGRGYQRFLRSGACTCDKDCRRRLRGHIIFQIWIWGFVGMVLGVCSASGGTLAPALVSGLVGPFVFCPATFGFMVFSGSALWPYPVATCLMWIPAIPMSMGANKLMRFHSTKYRLTDATVAMLHDPATTATSFEFLPSVQYQWQYVHEFDYQTILGHDVARWDRMYCVPVTDPDWTPTQEANTWVCDSVKGDSDKDRALALFPTAETVLRGRIFQGSGAYHINFERFTHYWEGVYQAAKTHALRIPVDWRRIKIMSPLTPKEDWEYDTQMSRLLGGAITMAVLYLLATVKTCCFARKSECCDCYDDCDDCCDCCRDCCCC